MELGNKFNELTRISAMHKEEKKKAEEREKKEQRKVIAQRVQHKIKEAQEKNTE